MISSINDFQNPFFIGIAGSGMSALAQYLIGLGKNVSGSDRFFNKGEYNETEEKLKAEGIQCFIQDGSGITNVTDVIVVSAAIEDSVIEVQIAKQRNIPILKRAELLSLISKSKKTIAIGGTSGKSTTAAMLFEILEYAGVDASIITGAGLTRLIEKGKIGNAKVGKGEWLVIEADESDGSIVEYHPEIGVLLNIGKDHKEIDELLKIFETFKLNSKKVSVNQSYPLTRQFFQNIEQDFSTDEKFPAGFLATDFIQNGFEISFDVNDFGFTINQIGKHNMENAVAATAVANQLGIDLKICSEALNKYKGIYRRHQLIGKKNGVYLIDDYAHNPVKCAASIAACQPISPKVIAWFQPHGYGPTKFLRHDFVDEIGKVLRLNDEIWMSEIFYVGGTTEKDISANDLINNLKSRGKQAFFVENRNEFMTAARSHLTDDCVLLLMGARDPSLEKFATEVWEAI
jgi:UDP-N-acetylmuramate--alanine ligase